MAGGDSILPGMAVNKKKKIRAGAKKISLALQGGGTHAAFTWGCLDRFLEDDAVEIEGISGVSAGAMNAALLVYGVNNGGKQEARKLLESFWRKVNALSSMSPFQPTIIDRMFGNKDLTFSPSFYALDYLTRLFSPYQFNFFDLNPMRDLLAELLDFSELRKGRKIDLFVNASNVKTGKPRVFSKKELDMEMLMASGCLPFLSKSVEVEGEFYWDGGYSGNPSLRPLIKETDTSDIVIIQVNPLNNEDVPLKAQDILNRVNEISFNNSLLREVGCISLISELIASGKLKSSSYRRINLHMIGAEEIMTGFGPASKFNADWDFLIHLKETGRQAADDWLENNYEKIGEESSLDVEGLLK